MRTHVSVKMMARVTLFPGHVAVNLDGLGTCVLTCAPQADMDQDALWYVHATMVVLAIM